MEKAANGQGEPAKDIPDPKAAFEQKVIDQEQVDDFQSKLSETDMLILKMRMDGSKLEDIAKAAGYKTASAVKKRIDKIAAQYEQFHLLPIFASRGVHSFSLARTFSKPSFIYPLRPTLSRQNPYISSRSEPLLSKTIVSKSS